MPWSLGGNSASFIGSREAGQVFSAAPSGGKRTGLQSWGVDLSLAVIVILQGCGLGQGCLTQKQALRRMTAESCYLEKKKDAKCLRAGVYHRLF